LCHISGRLDTEEKIKAHRRAGFAPELGRVLQPHEWTKLRECIERNPEVRLCRNEIYNGRAFFQYNPKSKAGMFWATKEKLLRYNINRRTVSPVMRAFQNAARNGYSAQFKTWARKNADGAKRRGIQHSLTTGELKCMFGAPCFFCGSAPPENKSWGIDRLNNKIGYHYDNCVPCCRTCNIAKATLGFEEFVAHVAKITANIGHILP